MKSTMESTATNQQEKVKTFVAKGGTTSVEDAIKIILKKKRSIADKVEGLTYE